MCSIFTEINKDVKAGGTDPGHKWIKTKRLTVFLIAYYMCVKFHIATMRGSMCPLCNWPHLGKTRGETARKHRETKPP